MARPSGSPSNRSNQSFSTTDEMKERIAIEASRTGGSLSQVVNAALEMFFATKIKRSSWETVEEDDTYDEKRIYTYSEDRKGHSGQVRMWVPKNLAGQIGRIVSSGAVPELRSNNDFYRDALFHRAYKMAMWLDDGQLMRETRIQMMLAEEDRIAQVKRDMDDLCDRMDQNLSNASKRKDWLWMDKYISDRMDLVVDIPAQFRDQYMSVLERHRKDIEGRF